MKTTIRSQDFHNAFTDSSYRDNFSYQARKALFSYFEQIEEETGEEIELDVCAICCDYTEYASLADIQNDYPQIHNWRDLENHTIVVCGDEDSDCIVIQSF